MKTITIYKSDAGTHTLTKTEREVLFDQLGLVTPIDKYHYDAFSVGDDLINVPKSMVDISGVILRNHADYLTYIVKKETSTEYSVGTQLARPAYTTDSDLRKRRVAAAGTVINSSGVIFDTQHTEVSAAITPQIHAASIPDKLLSGCYTHDIELLEFSKRRDVIHFTSESDALSKLKKVQAYVAFRKSLLAESANLILRAVDSYPYKKIILPSNVKVAEYKQPPIIEMKAYPNRLVDNHIVLLYDISSGGIWELYSSERIHGSSSEHSANIRAQIESRQADAKQSVVVAAASLARMSMHHKYVSIAWDLYHKKLTDLSLKEHDIVKLNYQNELAYNAQVADSKCEHLLLLSRIKRKDMDALNELKEMVDPQSIGILTCNKCKLPAICSHSFESVSTERSELQSVYMQKYVAKTPVEGTYFCKYCGASLVKIPKEASEFNNSHTSVERDELSSKIWKECRSIVQAQVYFNIVTDLKLLTSSIADIVYQSLRSEYLKASLARDENMSYLYINIYIYACLVRLMLNNSDMRFVLPKKSKNVAGGAGNANNTIQILIKQALQILVKTKESLIQKLVHVNVDSIKAIFISAFKQMASAQVTVHSIDNLDASYVVTDPTYKYMHYAMSKTKQIPITDVKSVLKASLDDLADMETIIDNNPEPPMWPLKIPVGVFSSNAEAEKYHVYSYASFLHFMQYISRGIYRLPLHNSIKRSEYEKEYKLLFNLEKTMVKKKTYRRYMHYGGFRYHDMKPSEIYCISGRRHKFNKYIYESNLINVELMKSNVAPWILIQKNNTDLLAMKMKTIVCSLCDAEKVGSLSDDLVMTAVAKLTEIDSFFNYYTFKCPGGNTHKPIENCVACGATRVMIMTRDMAYYDKYVNKFRDDMKIVKKRTVVVPDLPADIKLPGTWEIQPLTQAIVLSKYLKVSINIIRNIGLVESHVYDDIVSGKIDPVSTELKKSPARVTGLNNYALYALIEFEQVRNGSAAICSEWNDQTEYGKISFMSDYIATYKNLQVTDPEIVANFILITLCTAMNELNVSHPENQFVRHMMTKIINMEKSTSDPGIIRGKVIESEEVDAEEYVEAEMVNDPFSMENSGFDMKAIGDNLEGK